MGKNEEIHQRDLAVLWHPTTQMLEASSPLRAHDLVGDVHPTAIDLATRD